MWAQMWLKQNICKTNIFANSLQRVQSRVKERMKKLSLKVCVCVKKYIRSVYIKFNFYYIWDRESKKQTLIFRNLVIRFYHSTKLLPQRVYAILFIIIFNISIFNYRMYGFVEKRLWVMLVQLNKCRLQYGQRICQRFSY